jgi:hypothetical protein
MRYKELVQPIYKISITNFYYVVLGIQLKDLLKVKKHSHPLVSLNPYKQ